MEYARVQSKLALVALSKNKKNHGTLKSEQNCKKIKYTTFIAKIEKNALGCCLCFLVIRDLVLECPEERNKLHLTYVPIYTYHWYVPTL